MTQNRIKSISAIKRLGALIMLNVIVAYCPEPFAPTGASFTSVPVGPYRLNHRLDTTCDRCYVGNPGYMTCTQNSLLTNLLLPAPTGPLNWVNSVSCTRMYTTFSKKSISLIFYLKQPSLTIFLLSGFEKSCVIKR